MKTRWYFLSGLLVFLLLSLWYARNVEPHRLVVRHIEIPASKWRGEGDGLRVLQLSDLHLPSMSLKLQEKVLNAVRDESPDMLVITGDVLSNAEIMEPDNGRFLLAELSLLGRYLGQMQAPLGIWMARGNHDLGDDKEVSDRLVHLLRGQGIHLLTDQKESVLFRGQELLLLGVDYTARDTATVCPFVVQQEGGQRFLQSGPSRKNSYTHYHPAVGDTRWSNYTVSARLWLSNDQKSGVGLTFYSQFHQGMDHYYRFRWSPTETYFRFSPHNASITHGQLEVPVTMKSDCWYWCKVQVRNEAKQIRMAAKVWEEGAVEPQQWQATAFDSSSRRFTAGTVGFWSIFDGLHRFDDLLVVAESGDTLLREDWQQGGEPQKPLAWIDFHYSEAALPFLTAGAPDSAFSLLLCHSPETIEAAAAVGIDLMLSGHTHGGQLRLPLLGAPHLRLGKKYRFISGLAQVGSTRLYVNQGLGTIYLPMRFLAPPELTVFHIVPAGL